MRIEDGIRGLSPGIPDSKRSKVRELASETKKEQPVVCRRRTRNVSETHEKKVFPEGNDWQHLSECWQLDLVI